MHIGSTMRPLTMPRSLAPIVCMALACVALVVGGCSSKSGNKMPNYKQNPNPTHVFDLTITVSNAPGPLVVLEGVMQYDITNMDCLPPADSFSGVQTTPISTFLPLSLRKVSDNTYEGRVALDGLVDGDYFGHGVCHFEPVGSSVGFAATGAAGETRFVARLSAEKIANSQSDASYYWRGVYPAQQEIADYSDHGLASPEEYKESLRGELFSVAIAAKTVQP